MRLDKRFPFLLTCIANDYLLSATLSFAEKPELRFECGSHEIKQQVKFWLEAYLDQKPIDFKIPTLLTGTPFQKKVWATLQKIPFGKTKTYKEIAEESDVPDGARAIGNACGKNPLILFIPCHRVIKSDQTLGGFGLGGRMKQALLSLESISLKK